MAPDPRTVVGSYVHALAKHVAGDSHSKRLYGLLWNSKMVDGVVVSATRRTPEGKQQSSTFITATYVLADGGRKLKELNSRSVLPGPVVAMAATAAATTTQDDEIGTMTTTTTMMTAGAAATAETTRMTTALVESTTTTNAVPPTATTTTTNAAMLAPAVPTNVIPPMTMTTTAAAATAETTMAERTMAAAAETTTTTTMAAMAEDGDGQVRTIVGPTIAATVLPTIPPTVPPPVLPTPTTMTMVGGTTTNQPVFNATTMTATAAITTTTTETTTTTTTTGPTPVSINHGQNWFDCSRNTHVGPTVAECMWYVRDTLGNKIHPDCINVTTFSRMDIFLQMFSPSQLEALVALTNLQLRKNGIQETTKGEMVKSLGVIILITRYKFSNRRDLWKTESACEFFENMDYDDLGDLPSYLGVQITKHADRSLELGQPHLTQSIISALGLSDSRPKATPATRTYGKCEDSPPLNAEYNYRSVVGMLMYLGNNNRPDLAFAIHQCARFSANPRAPHGEALKRIGRYLQATPTKGLILKPTKQLNLDCYVDADFAGIWGNKDAQGTACVRSRTGFIITLGGCPMMDEHGFGGVVEKDCASDVSIVGLFLPFTGPESSSDRGLVMVKRYQVTRCEVGKSFGVK